MTAYPWEGDEPTADSPAMTAEEHRNAQILVCAYATDAADAATLLAMLGLDESPRTPDYCWRCGRLMTRLDGLGYTQHSRDGLCISCDGPRRRAEKRAHRD